MQSANKLLGRHTAADDNHRVALVVAAVSANDDDVTSTSLREVVAC
jgi:hypothetical protein